MKSTDVFEFRSNDTNEVIKGNNLRLQGVFYVVDVLQHKGGERNFVGRTVMLNCKNYTIPDNLQAIKANYSFNIGYQLAYQNHKDDSRKYINKTKFYVGLPF